MDILEAVGFRKKKLTKADDGKEALWAYELIDQARKRSLSTAVDKLREFEALVHSSSQQEIYDPDAVQKVLGEHIFEEVKRTSPESLAPRLPISIRPGLRPALSLEEAIGRTMFMVGEITNGLLNEKKATGYAIQQGHKFLGQRYQEELQNIARVALERERDLSFQFGKLVLVYKEVHLNYEQDVPAATIPTINIKQEGDSIERNTTRVVYRAGLNHLQARLRAAFANLEEEIASDAVAELLKEASTTLEQYALPAELSVDEKAQLQGVLNTFHKTHERAVANVSATIGKRQDQLYATVETNAKNKDYNATVAAIDELTAFTSRYTLILEETADEIRTKAGEIMGKYFDLTEK